MRKIEKVLGAAGKKLFRGFIAEKDISPSEIDHTAIKNILIVVRHQMGDMLCASPMMRSVRNFYPGAHIMLVTKKSTAFDGIFKDNNSPVDEVKYYEHGFENFLNLAKELKEKKIDLAIVSSTVIFSGTNHFLAHYSEAGYKAGVKSKDYEENSLSYLLNIKNDFLWDSKKVHQIERNLDVIRQINISPLENIIKLSLRDSNGEFAEKFIEEHFPDRQKPVIGIHPGAGKEQNVWPAGKFAEMINMLHNEYSAYIFISEGPQDAKYVNEVERLLREKYNIRYAKHKGELMNNAAIISKLSLFISNDTGVMHIASGFDVPLIALFGPTKAYEWGPVGAKKLAFQGKNDNINSIEILQIYETCKELLGVKYIKN